MMYVVTINVRMCDLTMCVPVCVSARLRPFCVVHCVNIMLPTGYLFIEFVHFRPRIPLRASELNMSVRMCSCLVVNEHSNTSL